jgi:hypothetical protein
MIFESPQKFDAKPLVDSKVAEELHRLRAGIETATVFDLVWQKCLSPEERKSLEPDIEGLTTVSAWQRVRGGSKWRAVLDIARRVSFITNDDYVWLCRCIGEGEDASTSKLFPRATAAESHPFWDRETGSLFYRGKLCRKVQIRTIPTRSQIILDAFESKFWRNRIEDPFEGHDAESLYQAVKSLNRGLKRIRFRVQEGGSAITWT